MPDPALMAAAKTRGFVFAVDPVVQPDSQEDTIRRGTVTWMAKEGFQHVQPVPVAVGQSRYPNIQPEFLNSAMEFLDMGKHVVVSASPTTAPVASAPPVSPTVSPTATPAPVTTVPAQTQPAAVVPVNRDHEQAVRLLKVAKLYVDAKRHELAREKLRELLKKYPNDPAAVAAKAMMAKLPEPP